MGFILLNLLGNIFKSNRIENRWLSRAENILGRSFNLTKKEESCCDIVVSLDSFSAETAETASSSVGRCIQTHNLVVVIVIVVTPNFMILVFAATIIHLMDCLYGGFMDRKSEGIAKEPSSAAEVTSTTATKAATAAKEPSSAAEVTSTTATKAATAAESAKAAPC